MMKYLKVPTRKLESDFLQGQVEIEQWGMALNRQRESLDCIIGRNFLL